MINNFKKHKLEHPIKIEALDIPVKKADKYVEVIRDFLEQLSFNEDRVEAFECRSRDGFSPYSYNNGGLQGITYRDANSSRYDLGFPKAEAILEKYSDYTLECFCTENNLDKNTYGDWDDDQREKFYEYESSGDDTVQFMARVMMTSETSAQVDFYVSASDTPYHRTSDDKLELDIRFKTPSEMRKKLAVILKKTFVQKFKRNVREGY
jgi:hypothetical protein